MLQSYEESGNTTIMRAADPIRVLIVERHGGVRHALYQRLRAAAHLEVVGSVNDLQAALAWLAEAESSAAAATRPDVIVVGLENGTDEQLHLALRQLRQLTECNATVISLAPYADEGVRTLLQQAGVTRYLLKHIDSCRLIREIEAAAGQSPAKVRGS